MVKSTKFPHPVILKYTWTHTLFDTITHASYTNISAIPITMKQKTNPIAVSSTGTAKHRKASVE